MKPQQIQIRKIRMRCGIGFCMAMVDYYIDAYVLQTHTQTGRPISAQDNIIE